MHCLWEIIDNGVDEALAGVRAPGRGDPPPRRLRRGPRRRPRHPDRQGAQDRAARRRGGRHQAARRRQVRRRLVRRHRRPARRRRSRSSTRCRRGWTSTSTARRPSRACRFQRGVPGVFDGDGPTATFTPKSGLTRKGKRVAKGKTGTRIRFWPDRQIFTKDADVRVRGAARPGPADVVHRARPRAGDPRPARRRPPSRRSSATTAASPSSSSSSPTTSRSPTCSGCRAPTPSPRPCRCSTTRAT